MDGLLELMNAFRHHLLRRNIFVWQGAERSPIPVVHVMMFYSWEVRYSPVISREDSEGAMCLALRPLSSGGSKYIGVRNHWIRDFLVKVDKLTTQHASLERQHTDVQTKPLSVGRFKRRISSSELAFS